jgi:hypothetical protein
LSRDISQEPEVIKVFVNEIREMISLPNVPGPSHAPLNPGTMRVGGNGAVQFASPIEAEVFAKFCQSFDDVCCEVLRPS